jgi:hypothetical protein
MKDPHDDGPRARLLEIGTCRSVARADRPVTLGFRLISVNTAVRTREQPRRTGAGTAPRRNVDRRSGGCYLGATPWSWSADSWRSRSAKMISA